MSRGNRGEGVNLYKMGSEAVAGIHLVWIFVVVAGLPLRYIFSEVQPMHNMALVITVVAFIVWRGKCPLSLLENRLRFKADPGSHYADGFLSHYLSKFTDIDIHPKYFTLILFGIAGVAIFF